jgi:hypothetical protein
MLKPKILPDGWIDIPKQEHITKSGKKEMVHKYKKQRL